MTLHHSKNKKRVLIVGCGKIGLRLAEQLSPEFDIWGVRRSACSHPNVQFIQGDVSQADQWKDQCPEQVDYLVYCLTPGERTEQAYRQVYVEGLQQTLQTLSSHQLRRIIFVSSTSVYHQDDSTWVDEMSETRPKRFSGKLLLEAEAILGGSEIPSTVVRFSGIYGGQRSHLINQVKSGTAKLSKASHLTNRIHEDDCVGFLRHLIEQDHAGHELKALYLASDSEPVEYNVVVQFLADQLKTELAFASEERPRRAAGNKKCSNKAMLESGYELLFPSYREGYEAMLGNHLEE